MATIWCITAPLYSHTDWGGFLKTAQVLQNQGHEVIWISEQSLENVLKNTSIPFQAIDKTGWLWPPPPQPDVSKIPPQEAVHLRYKRALDTWLSEDIVAEATQAIIDLAEKIGKPDLILTDPFLSAVALASEAINVPMIVCGWPAQGTLDDQLLFPVQRDLGTDSQQRIQRLLDQFNLEGTNFSKGATPSILSPHLHICYFTRDWYMAEAETLLSQNVFVGGLPETPQDDPPTWLTDIPEDTPIALITLGTVFTGDLGFFSWAAQASAKEGLLPVVVIGWNPISPDNKKELLNALPQGTRLLNWVPFAHVLPRTRIMIHHGGMGTTHYAVVNGIVQIAVPHAADQRVQARRIAQARIGLNLSAHDVRNGMLWEGVKALKDDQTVQQTASDLAQAMRQSGGPERAANLIAKYLP